MKKLTHTPFLVVVGATLLFLSFLIAANKIEFSSKIMDPDVQKKYAHYDNPQVCLGCHVEK